ncbi:MAG: hypothetical protein U0793_34295 [Gemmataceae bacterium]
MSADTVRIVDNGRGPQLSTSRITVQDLLPFYRDGSCNDEIRRWLPTLGDEEIAVLKDYLRDHYEEVLRAEADIKAYHDRMKVAQPSWTHASEALSIEERQARLRKALVERGYLPINVSRMYISSPS